MDEDIVWCSKHIHYRLSYSIQEIMTEVLHTHTHIYLNSPFPLILLFYLYFYFFLKTDEHRGREGKIRQDKNREKGKPKETLNYREQSEGCWRGEGWGDGVIE